MDFPTIVKERYACKLFNGKAIAQEKVDELLEFIKLAPSSFGLQPFKVLVITDSQIKKKLEPASWNQPQVASCSHLLVFCANIDISSRIDMYGEIMRNQGYPEDKIKQRDQYTRGSMERLDSEKLLMWAQNQVFIALGNAMNGATYLGFDSCPMGGFKSDEYTKILDLPNHLIPTVVLPIGYAADTKKKKIRFSDEELFLKNFNKGQLN